MGVHAEVSQELTEEPHVDIHAELQELLMEVCVCGKEEDATSG